MDWLWTSERERPPEFHLPCIMISEASELLGPHGPFVQQLDHFRVRTQQQQMADAILQAVDQQRDLVVEAGTGTGKTFAYLVPAICSGRKVIISTGTKNLQDQLFNKDVPLVRNALNIPVSFALLKGRSNYLCLHRFKQQMLDMDNLPPVTIKQLHDIAHWTRQTRYGDIAEYTRLPEGDILWSQITSTSDNCLGSDCSDFQDCHVMRARREAQAADVIIINHHLLLSDMALLEEGFGELLPKADVYIIDEAHQLAEVASGFFGLGISSQQFIELASDIVMAYLEQINEDRQVERLADTLTRCARDLRLAFGKATGRAAWTAVAGNQAVLQAVEQLSTALDDMKQCLLPLCERSGELDNACSRLTVLQQRFKQLTQPNTPEHIHWYEVHARSVTLHLTPLSIADAFQEKKSARQGSWIFTSATLSVAGKLDYFVNGLGLLEYDALLLESPFDFSAQALLYLPVDLPEPNTGTYTPRVIEKAIEVLKHSEGRAFFLFTSFRALNLAREQLAREIPYPLLVQGEAPRDRLLERFRQTPNAVLLGTNSFWEGVDVRGEALSCVIIDKLPFASPNDPVLEARLDALKAQGINPFMNYQLPRAVIMLKQGVGRLIRDVDDYGILMLCDPRLTTKFYGKTFLNSLPGMPRTTEVADVMKFYQKHSVVS